MAKQSSFRNKMKPKEWDMVGKRTLLTLDLSREDYSHIEPLAQLPEEVFELKELEALDLTNNTNIDLSDQLTKLTNLKLLCLDKCGLKTVPAAVMKLPQLEMLILSNNKNITLPDEMSGLTNLTVLDLKRCNLDTILPVVLKLSNLQWLDLSAGGKSMLKISLPDELSKLNKLKVLRLRYCKLDTVPPAVLKLPQLEELDLSGNSGIHLPDGLAGLTNLRVLKLAGTGMETVPPVVWRLTQLEWLDLRRNQLQTLPVEIGQLTNVKHLDLPGCELRTLPPEVWRLTQLEWLDLRRNQLQTLPVEIGQLTNVKHLDLSRCMLRTLPPEVWRLTQLEWLDLSDNELQTLPAEIGQLANVKHLNLSNCKLHTLPPGVWRLTQLERLDLSSNQLQTLPAEIGQLTNVKHLDLSRCKLRTLPPEVGGLTQLKELNLRRNHLQTLPAEIGQLTNVKHLDLSWCIKLRTLPPEVGGLTQLKELDLRFNDLQTLPAEIGQLSSLRHLHVISNPLIKPPVEVCRQGIAAVRQYFEELERSEEKIRTHLKVVVLGEKMAGKTSLVQTLDKGESTLTNVEDRTHCVEITQWAPDDNITFEVYDFGGHDVYHLTHQFFLTPDAFYLLLVNLHTYSCSEERYTEAVGFWLDTLNARVPGAVVTIVGSKMDKCREAEINDKVKDLQRKSKDQIETWKSNTERQIKKLKTREPQSEEEQREIERQLERTQRLLDHPLRLIGMYCISSAEPASGLDTLKNHILESANDTKLFPTLRKILPRTWVEFEQKVYGLLDKGTEELEITRGEGDKSSTENNDSTTDKKQVTRNQKWITQSDCLELTDLPADRLEQVLSYLQQVGTILRYTDIPELKDYVFHDPPALIEIFKDLFHHNIEELFKTPRVKNADYNRTQLKGFQQDLRDCGLIQKKVMTYMLPPNIDHDIVTALMKHFGLCFELKAKDKTDVCQYRIPWYLQKQMPEEIKSVWPEDVPEDQEQLQLMCNITGFCPRGLFQRFSVGIHPLVKDRVDWKDGVMAYRQDYPVLVCSKPVEDDTYITMATRGGLAQAGEMWGVVHPLLEVLVQLLQEWPGVLYSLHVTCAHCIKAGQEEPWQFDLRDRTAEDSRDVRCPEVKKTASTSAELVYRPARLSPPTQVKPSQQENDSYKMTSDPRGVALIISNTDFTDSTRNRPGGAKDLDNLRKICGKLKLQQEIKQNLTAQEIAAVTKDVSKRDHSSYDCFVLFLLSHGAETGVLGTDGEHVSVDSIISSFQACKSLVGKPKLFFIQACRGGDRDKGLEQTDSATDEASSVSQTGTEASDGGTEATASQPPPTAPPPAPVESPDAGEGTLPTASDRLVMYATVHGHVSWRNSNTGTWLVEALADVITEHADTEELQDMLRMVNAKVADFKTETHEHEYKQQPEITHTLRKRLYFFPSSLPESSHQPQHYDAPDQVTPKGGNNETAGTPAVDWKKYFKTVITNVPHRWDDLAEELGFKRGERKAMKSDIHDSCGRCKEVLERWRAKKGKEATIQVLKQALIDIDEKLTADSLGDCAVQHESNM
ncbi:PREDICTED: malignant fibrous histiocytoma-amplified sequence 1 homolog [Branchiostoma belcheri]|uniref:Leucine-rich repeat protein SHOC-2 n=1 Tax=Branchiostoma belcheri TaxID=7741 RepID=A0A6P4YY18_BRABE|nr:PREDICTED: malignant fibrous histiocytoma-amplified sequence 1 homolog [Branchiostoma belcheri]